MSHLHRLSAKKSKLIYYEIQKSLDRENTRERLLCRRKQANQVLCFDILISHQIGHYRIKLAFPKHVRHLQSVSISLLHLELSLFLSWLVTTFSVFFCPCKGFFEDFIGPLQVISLWPRTQWLKTLRRNYKLAKYSAKCRDQHNAMKSFYLANNISSWIPKRINYVLHLILTARFLIQVSKAVVHIITPAVTKTVSQIF